MSAPDYAEKTESVVFCEGYHDRDFWAGWLEHLGWIGPRVDAATGNRTTFPDPFGKPVRKGQFGFSKNRRFVRVVECRGGTNVLGDALDRLRHADPVHHVIVNLDSDATDGGGPGPAEKRLAGLRDELKNVNGGAVPERSGSGSYKLGTTLVSSVVWRADDPETPGVPGKQTLERLVAASLAAAYPERAAGVDLWLKANPPAAMDGRGAILGKAYTWSYMAKWDPDLGRDGFYRHVWRDEAVAEQLRIRLLAIGASDIAGAL